MSWLREKWSEMKWVEWEWEDSGNPEKGVLYLKGERY